MEKLAIKNSFDARTLETQNSLDTLYQQRNTQLKTIKQEITEESEQMLEKKMAE